MDNLDIILSSDVDKQESTWKAAYEKITPSKCYRWALVELHHLNTKTFKGISTRIVLRRFYKEKTLWN